MRIPSRFRLGEVVFIKKIGFRKLVPFGYSRSRTPGWFMCNDGFIRHESRFRKLSTREARIDPALLAADIHNALGEHAGKTWSKIAGPATQRLLIAALAKSLRRRS